MQLSFLRAVKAHTIFLLSFVLLFTTGCEDDDHDNHDHGHTDADGFILESNGTEINKIISDFFEKLNLSPNKAEKDIGIYKSSISKMEQAKELIEELRIKDKKKEKK